MFQNVSTKTKGGGEGFQIK